MRNRQEWIPTKYDFGGTIPKASRDVRDVSRGSRLIGDILAVEYSKVIHQYAKGILLDLGCGNSPLYPVYKDRVSDILCVDWENTLHQRHHVDLEHDLNRPLPIQSASFDTILLTDVLEHIEQPDAILHEISRLLRPQGIAIIGVPFMYWVHEQPYDYGRYTEFRLANMAKSAGMNVITLYPYGGAFDVIFDILGKLVASRPLLSYLLNGVYSTVSLLDIGKRMRQGSSRQFPLGYILVAQRA
jgi:SAM-dependent methyltransferase